MKNALNNNAILLCGGQGARMAPMKSPCNKSLLPIRGVTNLERIIISLCRKGILDILIATNHYNAPEIECLVHHIEKDVCSNARISVHVSPEYTLGCNNVVTMKSVADYIGNTYIIETDQYYIEDKLYFLQKEPLMSSFFVTQKRGEEDWGVVSDNNHAVLEVLHNNPNNDYYCLAGIIYINKKLGVTLGSLLRENKDTTLYWEELIPKGCMYEHRVEDEYAIEFDNISDLVTKKLMTPDEIATLIDEKSNPVRLGSMTNTSYKISQLGKYWALRIPGYGTDRFIDHHRERLVESQIPLNLRPASKYFSDDNVKMSLFLDNYRTVSNLLDIPPVMRALRELHNTPITEGISQCEIDLKKEIQDYESIYVGHIDAYEDYDSIKSSVYSFLDKWFSTNKKTVVHRDLVPLNILISDDQDVKFIDWEYAGILSFYWDLASFIVEFADEYGEDIDPLVDSIIIHYPHNLDRKSLYLWIAVVDFVWSVWSLAKVVLGDDVKEYGIKRYNRARNILNSYQY